MPSDTPIALNDFRAGIFSDYHGGLSDDINTARSMIPGNGSAVIDGTYRCCADQSGALVPLPRVIATQGQALLPKGNAQADINHYGRASQIVNMLTDAVVTGPASENALWRPMPGVAADKGKASFEDNVQVFALYQYYYDVAGAKNPGHYWHGRNWHPWFTVDQQRDFYFDFTGQRGNIDTDIRGTTYYSGSMGLCRAQADAPSMTVNTISICLFITTRFDLRNTANTGVDAAYRPNANLIPAAQLALTSYASSDLTVGPVYPSGAAGGAQGTGTLVFYPHPYNTTFDAIWPYASSNAVAIPWFPQFAISHQGRVVVSDRRSVQTFRARHSRDVVTYTAINDPGERLYNYDNTAARGFGTEFGEENTTGIGVIASVTGSQLLIVKHNFGGYIIQGDLDNPTVVRMPYIEPTHGITSMAVNTPVGIIYGSRSGVFVWQGGDVSQNLSPQIEGFFWNHVQNPIPTGAEEYYEGNRGRFEYWHPWVCVPNNFMYDTRTNAWWRLDRPEDAANGVAYNVYCINASMAQMYAFPYKLTATQTIAYNVYRADLLATSYSWRSQPLVETRGRVSSFQDVTLTVTPSWDSVTSTVVVTLSGFDEFSQPVAPVSVTFLIAGQGDRMVPLVLNKNIQPNFVAMYVQVRIEATATAPATAQAPKVHGVQFGTAERQEIRHAP